ncbi:general transcription factor II-I repeat domain-containing protein 2B-like [Hypanus sabinus]|uniref:general transcription factor II-I repeat domain-containing protein 2B-like n=1 Tax=Hypanus sabinus TaxID=79690 RepID=UPI0028C48F2A|nr:general transcription factor II-I repeat domain-containing protein 2B-like [Hypanus sabinus]
MREENGAEVRWLSQGKVLRRCFELREEICQFMESKGKDTTELRDKKLLCEMAFLCDITSHLNALNLQLQGLGRVITDMYAAVRAFKTKLRLWETQMQQENLSHFLCCRTMKEQVSHVQSLLKNLAYLVPTSHGCLPTLKPKKAGLNCSVIHLQLTWKAHQPAYKWS